MPTDAQPRSDGAGSRSRALRALQAQVARPVAANGWRADAKSAGGLDTEVESPALDYPQLRRRFRGRDDLIRKALALFHDECTEGIAELRRCLSAGQAEKAAEVAHRIKGAAGTVAAGTMRVLADRVETGCRESPLDELAGRMMELSGEAERVVAQLHSLLRV